jgi:cadmium resistance protein CadD (predicted permease)
MDPILPQIGLALIIFVSTNFDDIILLAAFFSNKSLHPKSIVAGQFFAIGSLTLISAGAALLALSIPSSWIAVLGLLPIALGLYKLYELYESKPNPYKDPHEIEMSQGIASKSDRYLSQSLSVATVTFINGGDNFAIYIPTFAANHQSIPIYIVVFAIMTSLWCLLGFKIVNNPVLGSKIRKHAHKLLPFVLIFLGLDIISGIFD